MRQLLKTQLLDALRDTLQDLENLKLVSPNEPDVLLLRGQLRSKVIEIENEQSTESAYFEVAA